MAEDLRIEGPNGGILAGIQCIVRRCTVTVTVSGSGAATGIVAFTQAVIADCVVASERPNCGGITVNIGATIRDCTVSGNGRTAVGIGLYSGSLEGVAVRDFDVGIRQAIANGAVTVHRATVQDCNTGIFLYNDAMIADCVINAPDFTAVGTGPAIEASNRVTVTNAVTYRHSKGIKLATSASLARCTASSHSAEGFSLGDRANVSGCTALYSASGIVTGASAVIIDCLAANNTTDGIHAGDGAKVTGCTVRQNGDTGIEVTGGAFISENNCDGNRYGIYGNGAYSRVERNNIIYHSDTGLWLSAGGNTVFGNTFRGNPTHILAPGSDVGPTGSAATATSPFANILF
jgi:hypothetical protein